MPREDQNSSEAHLTVKKLFVAGLRDGIDQESLREYFTRFGNVTEVLVMKDRDGSSRFRIDWSDTECPTLFLGKPRGFAFVSFDDYDAVDKAILGKPHTINGRPLDIKKAIPKEKMQDMGPPSTDNGSPSNRNYSGGNGPRNNYSQGRDSYSDNWGNQGGMPRSNNSNQNYNQPPMSSYPPQGYGPNGSSYNSSMSAAPNNGYPSSYSTNMAQNPPQSMMGYDGYNTNTNTNSGMPFNNSSNPNYLPPPPPTMSSYGSNQQQGFGNMSNAFNVPDPSSNASGYSDGSSSSNPYGNGSSYGMMSQNYGTNNNGGNYNTMPQQASQGGGPMRGGRGWVFSVILGGVEKNSDCVDPLRKRIITSLCFSSFLSRYSGGSGYNGNSDSSNFGARPAPYTTRGGRGGGVGGRGRGRGQ